jgi:hypothetical protein
MPGRLDDIRCSAQSREEIARNSAGTVLKRELRAITAQKEYSGLWR